MAFRMGTVAGAVVCCAAAAAAAVDGIVHYAGPRVEAQFAQSRLRGQPEALARKDYAAFTRPYKRCRFLDERVFNHGRRITEAEFRSVFARDLSGLELTDVEPSMFEDTTVDYTVSGRTRDGRRKVGYYEINTRVDYGGTNDYRECSLHIRRWSDAGRAGQSPLVGTWKRIDAEDENDLDATFHPDGRAVLSFHDTWEWVNGRRVTVYGSGIIALTYEVRDAGHVAFTRHHQTGIWGFETASLRDGTPVGLKLTDLAGHQHYLSRTGYTPSGS